MPILENIPPVLIGWLGPLFIILPYTLLLRRWLRSPYRFAGLIYAAAIITGIIVDVTMDVSDRQSAVIAGLRAPLIYCLLLTAIMLPGICLAATFVWYVSSLR